VEVSDGFWRQNPCYVLGIMLNDPMTAFFVAFAAVTASREVSVALRHERIHT
jgi:hypothetical protein